MAVLVHVGPKTYVVDQDQISTADLGERIKVAVETGKSFVFPALIGAGSILVYVNTGVVDVIGFDPEGVGIGFFHG